LHCSVDVNEEFELTLLAFELKLACAEKPAYLALMLAAIDDALVDELVEICITDIHDAPCVKPLAYESPQRDKKLSASGKVLILLASC
jgi:hypothetical protein